MALWAENKVPFQNIQIPLHFGKKRTNIRWLLMILKKNSNREGDCPTLILIQFYCGRKVVKAKGRYQFIEVATMEGHIGGMTLLESHGAVGTFRNSSLPHFFQQLQQIILHSKSRLNFQEILMLRINSKV